MSTATATAPSSQKAQAASLHWPEYACEAAGLAIFMLSACAFTALLEHPSSGIHSAIGSPFLRRVLMGIAMGATALAIISSKLGKRSGAHLNPAVTGAYLLLGKVRRTDAAGYIAAHLAGGAAGVLLAAVLIGPSLSHSAVRYAATVPGPYGLLVAFCAEFVISFVLMLTVLTLSNSRDYTRLTPLAAAALLATWITFEAPLSGMSMNPARTVASALHANVWTGWWIYFTAPPLAMSAAALLYLKRKGIARVYCAKLHHHNPERCIFHCRYGAM